MSDFYKCEHGSTLCGTCTRALKTQHEAIKAELSQTLALLADEKKDHEAFKALFRGRMEYCDDCLSTQKDRDKWRGVVEKLFRYARLLDPGSIDEERDIRETLDAFAALKGESSSSEAGE